MYIYRLMKLLDGLPSQFRFTLLSPSAGVMQTTANCLPVCGSCRFSSSPVQTAATQLDNPHPSPSKQDQPVQYSTSNAFIHKFIRFDSDDGKARKFQARVVALSLMVFMVYFFYLREENDLDRFMETPLWDRVPGLEKQTVVALIDHLEKSGKDASAARKRLAELKAEEAVGLAPSFDQPRIISIHPQEVAEPKRN